MSDEIDYVSVALGISSLIFIVAIVGLAWLMYFEINAPESPAADIELGKFPIRDSSVVFISEGTGSMLPTIGKGHLIYAEPIKSIEELNIGDMVIRERTDTVVVHRVVAIGVHYGEEYVITSGDRTGVPDSGRATIEDVRYKVVAIVYDNTEAV